MSKELTQDELQKAHKAVVDHITKCAGCVKASHDAHVAMSKAHHDEHMANLNAMHKAVTGEDMSVPMETTKSDKKEDLAKSDAKGAPVTDDKIEQIVAQTIAKAFNLPVEKDPKDMTIEERIEKAVSKAIAPLMKADPTQNKPRNVAELEKASAEMSDQQRSELAKAAASGDRDAVAKLFAATGARQAVQMVN